MPWSSLMFFPNRFLSDSSFSFLQFFNCFQNLGADRMLKSNQTQVICAPAAFCTLHTLAHAGYET
jgi:hypothetical protein